MVCEVGRNHADRGRVKKIAGRPERSQTGEFPDSTQHDADIKVMDPHSEQQRSEPGRGRAGRLHAEPESEEERSDLVDDGKKEAVAEDVEDGHLAAVVNDSFHGGIVRREV